ncbi:hypothetical protein OG390_16800 [Streptomyces sp. NBC_00996]|nr:hypothetical protein OG390_16800 [Streptomyces sp. NBC_00996]
MGGDRRVSRDRGGRGRETLRSRTRPHTDVETLTDNNGDTQATYGYTAYGKDDASEFTGIDKPDVANPTKEAYNPYRFNAERWDAQSGTYDMGFRDYSPGLNRFTTRDMYNGALADMGLGVDPYTGNRYAFGGGNPTSFIELDGHTSCDVTGMCGGVYRETPMIKHEEAEGINLSIQSETPTYLSDKGQKAWNDALDEVRSHSSFFANGAENARGTGRDERAVLGHVLRKGEEERVPCGANERDIAAGLRPPHSRYRTG